MNLECFDGKCVRIVTVSGKVYEGHATHNCAEYNWIECGVEQESLDFGPLSFFENEIADVISQEDVNGPFGHFSEAYGLLEKECLELGSDYIGEVFIQRMKFRYSEC